MKKQFFYAAMALAVMSSCSKDNDPGNGNPEENNDKAVIGTGRRRTHCYRQYQRYRFCRRCSG
mgnify:CR=1 FL=1